MALLKLSASVIRVVERVLGLTGTPLPTELVPGIQLSTEMRALRHFEEYDEGLIRWWGFFQQIAIAGQLSTIQFNPSSIVLDSKLRGAILTVDRIKPRSTPAVALSLAAGDGAPVGAAFAAASYRDTRWGPAQAAALAVQAAEGQAVASGAIVDSLADSVVHETDWTSKLNVTGFIEGDSLSVRSQAVNTPIACHASGRVWLPK